jgi:hypothetical protein
MPSNRSAVSWWRQPSFIYAIVIAVFCAVNLLQWPIQRIDTDLWTHLTAGRYLVTEGRIPSDSFFSFIDPPRARVDYAWLFQGVMYGAYQAAGYHGLIWLRAALYLATMAAILWLVFGASPVRSTLVTWPLAIVVLVAPYLLFRSLLLRPQAVTYALIVVFLAVLEHRPRWALWLPVLTVLWCNMHGIAYPMPLLILAVHGAERGIRRWRTGRSDPADGRVWAALPLAALATLATPHGLALVAHRFIPTTYTAQYIEELAPIRWAELTRASWIAFIPTQQTLLSVIALGAGLAVISALWHRRLRFSHLALTAVGLVLMTRGARFTHEFVLLCLPLLAASPPLQPPSGRLEAPLPIRMVGSVVLMLTPVLFALKLFGNPAAYPLSIEELPTGVAAFLQRVPPGGRVLNHPDFGGYLQWALYPRHTIYANMEVPFLFSDEDLFVGTHCFRNPEVFRQVVSRHAPSYLAVPIQEMDAFSAIAANAPEYQPVFFDDSHVLYVDSRRWPEVAQAHRLDRVDIASVVTQPCAAIQNAPARLDPLRAHLPRLLAIDPAGELTHCILAETYLADGAFDRALTPANAVVRWHPGSATGYRLLGQAWQGLGAWAQAEAAYREALIRLPSQDVIRRLGQVLFAQGRFAAAYEQLRRAIDPFAYATTAQDLVDLAAAARSAGRVDDAVTWLRYAAIKVASDDPLVRTIAAELSR